MTKQRYPRSTEPRLLFRRFELRVDPVVSVYLHTARAQLRELCCSVTGLPDTVAHDWVYKPKQHLAYYNDGFWRNGWC